MYKKTSDISGYSSRICEWFVFVWCFVSFKSCASHLFSSMYINIRYICINLTLVSLCIIIQFKQINQLDATVLQVYYLRFMCRSTCFGRLHLHQQELTTALTASGFTVGALVVTTLFVLVWRTTTNNAATPNAPTVKPEAVNAVVSSWWWAWRPPKYAERHKNPQVINLWNSCIHLVDLFEL